ncbi:MAG: DoxX family protein [Planctomycetota bacterium]
MNDTTASHRQDPIAPVRILDSRPDLATAIARVTLAVVMFPHGAQKLLGWFGGNGWSGTMQHFTETMGLPWMIAAVVILLESLGALSLLLGLFSRFMGLGFICLMVGAIITVHAQHGFFMDWQGQQEGEGFEYHLLAIALALVVTLRGGGLWSLDRLLSRRLARSET